MGSSPDPALPSSLHNDFSWGARFFAPSPLTFDSLDPMTLPSTVLDPLEAAMRIKVSEHVACCWSWTVESTLDDDEGPTFSVLLKKRHPLWDLVDEVVSHFPETLAILITDSKRWRALEERYSADVAQIEIPEELAQQLWPPLWHLVRGMSDDDE